MCGRYAASRNPDALVAAFAVDEDATGSAAPGPDYNVAPTKPVVAVLTRHPRSDDQAPPVRQLRVVRWGLVPSWAKDPSIGNRMINARAETLASKPSFKRAFAARRCLLPADGYYEWATPQGDDVVRTAGGRPRKQPFYLHPSDGSVLPMAGLYEFWRDRTRADDDPAAWLTTCTVITTDATQRFGRIHDRMPMAVAPENWAEWLDPDLTSTETASGLLVPSGELGLDVYPVSTAVNTVSSNGPALIDPLPESEVLPGVEW